MKYLYLYFIALLLGLSLGLSAQRYRLRAELGTAGIFTASQLAGPTAALGLEALVPLAPRTFLVPAAGGQFTSLRHNSNNDFPILFVGQLPVDFNTRENLQVRRIEATAGLGLEQHLDRWRVQVYGQANYRLHDRITYTHEDIFSGANRPDNVFEATVRPGERFQENMQTGTIRYNNRINLATGLSLRYDFTGQFELGFSLWRTLGNYQLERRIISFCENCPINEEAEPENRLPAGATVLQISSRYSF